MLGIVQRKFEFYFAIKAYCWLNRGRYSPLFVNFPGFVGGSLPHPAFEDVPDSPKVTYEVWQLCSMANAYSICYLFEFQIIMQMNLGGFETPSERDLWVLSATCPMLDAMCNALATRAGANNKNIIFNCYCLQIPSFEIRRIFIFENTVFGTKG